MDSSRRLGSISRKRTSAGVIRYRIEQSIALRPTDLPVPVAPATSRCGIAVRSDTTGPPVTSLPRASGSFFFGSTKSAEAKISRRYHARLGVRHLDGHGAPTGDRPDDAHGRGLQSEREIVGEIDDPADLHTGGRLELVRRDD